MITTTTLGASVTYLATVTELLHARGIVSKRDMGHQWNWSPTDRQSSKLKRLMLGLRGVSMPKAHSEHLRVLTLNFGRLNRHQATQLIALLEKVAFYRSWPAAMEMEMEMEVNDASKATATV